MVMHRFDQSCDMLGWRELVNPVAEVENEAGSHTRALVRGAETIEHPLNFLDDALRRCKQDQGVDIALQSLPRAARSATDRLAGGAQIHSPVQA